MEHPHLIRAWIEWIDRSGNNAEPQPMGTLEAVLVVATDLELNPAAGIDSSEVDDVIQAARERFAHRNGEFKTVRIVPASCYRAIIRCGRCSPGR